MKNEKTSHRKAEVEKDPPLEAVSAGAAEALSRPAESVVPKTISGRRYLRPEFWDALSHYNTKEMVLRTLRDNSEEYFINILEDLKRGIREKDYETAATNFANALYPPETKG